MPDSQEIEKAFLQPIAWTENGQIESEGDRFYVQFNPQSLKVAYANKTAGGDQRGGSAIQFVGRGTTKLTVEILFDVTVALGDGDGEETVETDVRNLTQRVAAFIKPDPERQASSSSSEDEKIIPPGVRFGWGAFQFEGVVDSIKETLEFFSNRGEPLRATLALEISRQDIQVRPVEGSPGTTAQHQVRDDETVQQAAGPGNWQGVAAANGIENPRLPGAGAMLNLSAGVSVSGGISAGIGISGGVSAGIGGGLSSSAGGSLSISAANNLSVGTAGSLGFGASSRTGASAGLTAGASITGGLGGAQASVSGGITNTHDR
jgi:hypothetical protein